MSKKNKKKKKGIAFFSRAKSATPEPMVAEEVTAAEMPAAGDSGVTVVPTGAFDYSHGIASTAAISLQAIETAVATSRSSAGVVGQPWCEP